MCILCQQTLPKRWFGNRTMTSFCDVTNSAHQIEMTTLCHWMKPPIVSFCVRHCLKKSTNNFFSRYVILGRLGPLLSACRSGKILWFCKGSKSKKEMFFCSSLHVTVLLTFCFTCFHANKRTIVAFRFAFLNSSSRALVNIRSMSWARPSLQLRNLDASFVVRLCAQF